MTRPHKFWLISYSLCTYGMKVYGNYLQWTTGNDYGLKYALVSRRYYFTGLQDDEKKDGSRLGCIVLREPGNFRRTGW